MLLVGFELVHDNKYSHLHNLLVCWKMDGSLTLLADELKLRVFSVVSGHKRRRLRHRLRLCRLEIEKLPPNFSLHYAERRPETGSSAGCIFSVSGDVLATTT